MNEQMSRVDRSSSRLTETGSHGETNVLQITLVCGGMYEVLTHCDAVKQSGRTCINKQVRNT